MTGINCQVNTLFRVGKIAVGEAGFDPCIPAAQDPVPKVSPERIGIP